MPVSLISPPKKSVSSQDIPVRNIYLCISDNFLREVSRIYKQTFGKDYLKIFTDAGREQIMSVKGFPSDLGHAGNAGISFVPLEKKLKRWSGRESLKIAIINGMSSSFGDSIAGLRALNIFHERVSGFFRHVQIDLYQSEPLKTFQLYDKEPVVGGIYFLPCTLDNLLGYDAYIDLDAIIARDEFNSLPLTDFYLRALSIDCKAVADVKKRSLIRINERTAEELKFFFSKFKTGGRKFLLFHSAAGARIRSMPQEKVPAFIERIIESTDYLVFSAVELEYSHERFIDVSKISVNFDCFACIVSMMDAVITVDSSTYHIADSFSIPTIVLFTSINPALRIKYYPYTDGILLGGKNNRILGRHFSERGQDIEYSEKLWDMLDPGEVIRKLDNLLKKR